MDKKLSSDELPTVKLNNHKVSIRKMHDKQTNQIINGITVDYAHLFGLPNIERNPYIAVFISLAWPVISNCNVWIVLHLLKLCFIISFFFFFFFFIIIFFYLQNYHSWGAFLLLYAVYLDSLLVRFCFLGRGSFYYVFFLFLVIV